MQKIIKTKRVRGLEARPKRFKLPKTNTLSYRHEQIFSGGDSDSKWNITWTDKWDHTNLTIFYYAKKTVTT